MNAISGKASFGEVQFVEGENFACLMPLRRARRPALGDLLKGIAAALRGSHARASLDPLHTELMPQGSAPQWLDPGVAFLIVNEVRVTIAWHDREMPRPSWAANYANRRLWPNAARDLMGCRASVVITEMGIPGESGPAAAFDRAAVVTLMAEALWPMVSGIGLLWSPARNGLPADSLGSVFETLHGGRAALTLWMRWREIVPKMGEEKLCPGIVTSGLRPLLGREIEAPPSPVPSQEMLQHVIRLASGLIDHQAEIAEGQELGRSLDLPILLHVATRGPSSGRPAYVLRPAAGYAA